VEQERVVGHGAKRGSKRLGIEELSVADGLPHAATYVERRAVEGEVALGRDGTHKHLAADEMAVLDRAEGSVGTGVEDALDEAIGEGEKFASGGVG